jgi:hypothetical protein
MMWIHVEMTTIGDLPAAAADAAAADAAESFDDGNEMIPFAFDLQIPEES